MEVTVFDSTFGRLLSQDIRFTRKRKESNAMFSVELERLSDILDLCGSYDVVIKGFKNQDKYRPVVFIYPKNKDYLTKDKFQ